jgi:hypothetical protein
MADGSSVRTVVMNSKSSLEPGEFERIERITLVQYFREKMTQCGTPQEELDRVKMM